MPTPNEVSERFGRVLSSVCSIQTGGNSLGTGFLVGPDTVLTNYHVVERIIDAAGQFVQPATCVFDYQKLSDGAVKAGVPIEVKGCLDWSSYGPAEVTDRFNDPMPTDEQLDYALLHLNQAVGKMQPPGMVLQSRGWIDLWDTPWDSQPPPDDGAAVLARNSRVFVIQHMLGAPQVYRASQFIGENTLRTRMRYDLVTDVGSSGSPCLTEEYKLFALHHLGDSSWNAVRASQGVPIKLIRKRIAKKCPESIPNYDVLADAKRQAPWSGLFQILGQYPQAKAAIRRSQNTIRTITGLTTDLRRHKAIHDVLQSIQGNLPMLLQALNEIDQKKSRDSIRLVARTMRQSWRNYSTESDELREAGKARGLREMDWIDEFSNALKMLVEADQLLDKMNAATAIQMHLRVRPPELNGNIRQILGNMPVSDLLEVFQAMIDAMNLEDGAVKAIVSAGPDLLRIHWERLRQNVADHNSWQDIDNELSMLEALPPGWTTDPRWFEAGWQRALPKTLAMCQAYPGEEWSIEMTRHAALVTQSIANRQWDLVVDHFPDFRMDMSNRFSLVDKSLLSGSEQIIQLGNPLSALVEASL